MKRKLKVLMELRPCFYGFSGIPQETRLLFSYFQHIPSIETTGLIDTHLPWHSLKSQYKSPHQKININSSLILSTLEENTLSFFQKLKAGFKLWQVSFWNVIGASLPLGEFDSQGFEDFIWEKLFAKTLSTEEFPVITQALFRALNLSRYTLRMIRLANFYPKLNTKDYDVFLTQTPFPGRVAKNTQLVVRYHDAVPLFTPHLLDDPVWHQQVHYRELCVNAKNGMFVCTSHSVREDLLKVFPHLERRSHVIYDTISPSYYEEQSNPQQLIDIIKNHSYESRQAMIAPSQNDEAFCHKHLQQTPLKYLIMVSTLEPRKNHLRLIRAWVSVCSHLQQDIKLILVGDIGWQVDPIISAMKPWQEQGKLFHLQKVPAEHLRLLYQGAIAVICPSVKEGFDLSGAEAMASGGKVLASNIPIHREVYGEGALYFDTYSIKDQAETILKLITHPEIAIDLKEKGLKQSQKYTVASIKPQWESFFQSLSH